MRSASSKLSVAYGIWVGGKGVLNIFIYSFMNSFVNSTFVIKYLLYVKPRDKCKTNKTLYSQETYILEE